MNLQKTIFIFWMVYLLLTSLSLIFCWKSETFWNDTKSWRAKIYRFDFNQRYEKSNQPPRLCQFDGIMFFLVLSVVFSKRIHRIEEDWGSSSLREDECQTVSDLTTAIKCSLLKFPSIEKVTSSEFGRCILGCRQLPSGTKRKCLKNCTTLEHSSLASKDCVLSCSNIKDPIHQTQCLDRCRSTSRFDPKNDYSDSCKRCTRMSRVIQYYIKKFSVQEAEAVRKSIQMACPTNVKLMPFCQSINTIGIDELVELLLKEVPAEEICSKINLC